jgi:hypothetical protein
VWHEDAGCYRLLLLPNNYRLLSRELLGLLVVATGISPEDGTLQASNGRQWLSPSLAYQPPFGRCWTWQRPTRSIFIRISTQQSWRAPLFGSSSSAVSRGCLARAVVRLNADVSRGLASSGEAQRPCCFAWKDTSRRVGSKRFTSCRIFADRE